MSVLEIHRFDFEHIYVQLGSSIEYVEATSVLLEMPTDTYTKCADISLLATK